MRAWVVLATAGLVAPPPAAARTGGRKVIIQGVDRYRVMDPLFECVRVVLSQRGEKYAPAYVQGISGAAFRIAGPCPCAPTCSAGMDTTDLVRLLGYECEHLKLFGKGVEAARDVHQVVARVKEEVRAGRPAAVWHAFSDAEWDVVCGYDDAKSQFLGRGSSKGLDGYAAEDQTRMSKCLHICPAIGAILVGRKTGKLDARAAELDALEEAVRHAHSPRDRFLAEAADGELPWRFREGLACYNCWVLNFRNEPNRVPLVGDRYCAGVYRSTHRAASEFMTDLAPRYPKAKAHLERAAGHFAAEGDALDELHKLDGFNWGSPSKPDPKRNARAAELLARARDAYAAGIGQIERALETIDPQRLVAARRRAVLRREDGKVWIRGVPPLAWGRGKECTFAGALEAATKVTDRPCTYADLMGLSALAFRVRWSNAETKTKWCPSCAVGEMPDEQAALAKLTGWRLPTDWIDAKGRDNEKLRKKLVASIDAGRAVLAYPPAWNMGVVYGYEDGGKVLLVRDYDQGEEDYRLPVEQLGPMHVYLGDPVQPPALRDCLREALQMGVQNWRRQKHDGGLKDREYWYGDAAFAAWIGDLRSFGKLDAKAQDALRGLDGWNYVSLHDARRAAVQFLKDWARIMDGEARKALERAAELYDKEAEALKGLVEDKDKPAKQRDGSQAAREKEIAVLREARKLDAAAIAEIEKALK